MGVDNQHRPKSLKRQQQNQLCGGRRVRRGIALVVSGLAATLTTSVSPGAEAASMEFCQFTANPAGSCGPEGQYWDTTGQELQLTLMLLPQGRTATEPPAAATPAPLPRKLNTIRDVFGALRTCFAGAPFGETTQELAATIRFSFTRDGQILGEPRFTYVQAGIPGNAKQAFEQAIGHALVACTPLPFTNGLGAAIAGRPLSIRVVKAAKPPFGS
jgi:hypothetical protein